MKSECRAPRRNLQNSPGKSGHERQGVRSRTNSRDRRFREFDVYYQERRKRSQERSQPREDHQRKVEYTVHNLQTEKSGTEAIEPKNWF